jgi:hypothetical protein
MGGTQTCDFLWATAKNMFSNAKKCKKKWHTLFLMIFIVFESSKNILGDKATLIIFKSAY